MNACIHRLGGAADRGWLSLANRMLAHRGPDGDGQWAGGPLGLGHTRLSIVDVAHGAQPLFNEDRSIVLVCNGEIYNAVALRRELRRRGHDFATGSDCEVIVHLYEEDPTRFVERLAGMFAFVLVDRVRDRVTMARDRLGIKPLFLAMTEEWLLASSEIKTLLRHRAVRVHLDAEVVEDTLTLGFAPGPRTVFEGVEELAPATCLTYRIADDELRRWQYWSADMSDTTGAELEPLRRLLGDVVSEHCLGELATAVYASGGLDSSIIAALLAKRSVDAPHAFSLVFPGSRFDESPYIDELMRHVQLREHRVPVSGLAVRELERTVYHLEQPQVVTLDAAQMRLSAAVREAGLKVVLAGDGPDELLGGYDHFAVDAVRRELADRNGSVPTHRLAELDAALLASGYPADFRAKYLWIAAREAPAAIERFGVFPPWFAVWRAQQEIKRPLLAGARDTLGSDGPIASMCGPLHHRMADRDDLDKAIYLETRSRLPSWILWKADRNGMANSVEVRVPFLDHRVVEYLNGLPSAMKSAPGETKVAIRRAFADMIPTRIAKRAKFAFNTPPDWLFTANDDALADLLSPSALREVGLFEPKAVRELYRSVRCNSGDGAQMLPILRSQVLTGVVTTQMLHRRFVA